MSDYHVESDKVVLRNGDELHVEVTITDGEPAKTTSLGVTRAADRPLHPIWGVARRPARPPQ